MKLSVNAYAKINLFLDIESIKENGYHNIISYMQSVDLHDIVTVEYTQCNDKYIKITCNDATIPCNEKNIAYKAAELFPCNNGRIIIDIQKNIPAEAGLAGGSADAAATLIALNKLFDNKLSPEELNDIGYKLGADVPFCIENGSCLATGIGEKLQKVSPMPKIPILIAKKGEGMSTPEAYRDLDEKYNRFINYRPNIEKLKILLSDRSKTADDISSGLYNIFESAVEPKRHCVILIKDIMKANGASGAMMSGSGTSVFGIFNSINDALNAKDALKEKEIASYICYPYDPHEKKATPKTE